MQNVKTCNVAIDSTTPNSVHIEKKSVFRVQVAKVLPVRSLSGRMDGISGMGQDRAGKHL